MAHRLDRLCHTLETKGPQEASLLLVDTLLSDMNRAADKFENAADRQVITNLVREYDSYKGRLLDAVHHVEVVLSDVTPKDQVIHPAPVRDTYQQTAPSRVRSGR